MPVQLCIARVGKYCEGGRGGGSDPDWLDDRMMEQFLSTVSLQWDIYYKHWDLDNILTIDNNIYLCL